MRSRREATAPPAARRVMELSRYHCAFSPQDHPGKTVLFSTKTASSLLLPSGMVEEIARGTVSEEESALLAKHGVVVESAAAERREMLDFVGELAAMDRSYAPLILLNLDCNLACAYCFEGTRRGRHYLSDETAERLLAHLRDRALPGREELGVVFYGGEPLLSFGRMLDLAPRMRTLCDAAGVRFHFSMITNGTLLTRERVAQLKPFGLRSACVTLDGPRETHDAARAFRSGRGSFELILRNLTDVADLVDLQIGGNFTRDNWREFPRLLDALGAAGLTPGAISQLRFDPVFREQEGIAPEGFHGGCTTFDEPWLCEASVFLREEILRRGYRSGRIMPPRCMMDYPNHPVINSDGAIYPCPGLIGREECRIGTIDERVASGTSPRPDWRGGAERGPPSAQRSEQMGVRSDRTPTPVNWQNEECLACAYLPLCFGGCRYMALLRTGSLAGLDCRKAYFDAVLERLVMQDIRYGVQV